MTGRSSLFTVYVTSISRVVKENKEKVGLLKDMSNYVLYSQNLTLEGGQDMEIFYGPFPHKKYTQSALEAVSGAQTLTLCPGKWHQGQRHLPYALEVASGVRKHMRSLA